MAARKFNMYTLESGIKTTNEEYKKFFRTHKLFVIIPEEDLLTFMSVSNKRDYIFIKDITIDKIGAGGRYIRFKKDDTTIHVWQLGEVTLFDFNE